jgi:hypothetical protein
MDVCLRISDEITKMFSMRLVESMAKKDCLHFGVDVFQQLDVSYAIEISFLHSLLGAMVVNAAQLATYSQV